MCAECESPPKAVPPPQDETSVRYDGPVRTRIVLMGCVIPYVDTVRRGAHPLDQQFEGQDESADDTHDVCGLE